MSGTFNNKSNTCAVTNLGAKSDAESSCHEDSPVTCAVLPNDHKHTAPLTTFHSFQELPDIALREIGRQLANDPNAVNGCLTFYALTNISKPFNDAVCGSLSLRDSLSRITKGFFDEFPTITEDIDGEWRIRDDSYYSVHYKNAEDQAKRYAHLCRDREGPSGLDNPALRARWNYRWEHDMSTPRGARIKFKKRYYLDTPSKENSPRKHELHPTLGTVQHYMQFLSEHFSKMGYITLENLSLHDLETMNRITRLTNQHPRTHQIIQSPFEGVESLVISDTFFQIPSKEPNTIHLTHHDWGKKQVESITNLFRPGVSSLKKVTYIMPTNSEWFSCPFYCQRQVYKVMALSSKDCEFNTLYPGPNELNLALRALAYTSPVKIPSVSLEPSLNKSVPGSEIQVTMEEIKAGLKDGLKEWLRLGQGVTRGCDIILVNTVQQCCDVDAKNEETATRALSDWAYNFIDGSGRATYDIKFRMSDGKTIQKSDFQEQNRGVEFSERGDGSISNEDFE